ncbi:MAG: lysostaphin resistance A-like protein [Pyrinomonadaceae bacterium]
MSTNEPASPDNTLIETYADTSDQPPSPLPPAVINPDDPPWGVGWALLVWGSSLAFLILIQIAVGVPYVIYKVTTGGSTVGLDKDPTLIFFSLLGALPAHALTFLVVWLVVSNRGRRPFWQTLGWSWPEKFGPWKTIALAVVLLGLGVLFTHFLGGKETALDQVINSSLKARFATAFLAFATAPLVEELVFRGVLFPALQRAVGVVWAILLVTILFAGIHVFQYYDNFGVVAVITMLSLALTMLRAHTGRLLPSFVLHLVFNGIQAVFLVVQPFLKSAPETKPVVGLLVHHVSALFN